MMPLTHATDDALELYVLHLLDDSRLSKIEEHLLICESCRINLTRVEQEVAAMKLGLSALELKQLREAVRLKALYSTVSMFKKPERK